MSNSLAIATVTAALASMVRDAVADPHLMTPQVEASALDARGDGNQPHVGVYLYRVSRNATYSVDALPLRANDGTLRHPAQAAVDVHYLLTFSAPTGELDAQKLLARTAAWLQYETQLGPERIAAAVATVPGLADTDLAVAQEPVRLVESALQPDELFRLWSLYPPGTFTPTLAVSAGPVVIELETTPMTPLPVLRPQLDVEPFAPAVSVPPAEQHPVITSLAATLAASAEPGHKSGTISVGFTPDAVPDETVVLHLDSRGLTPPVAVRAVARNTTAAPVAALDFAVSKVADGTYVATLEKGGLLSIPPVTHTPDADDPDGLGHYDLTTVTLGV